MSCISETDTERRLTALEEKDKTLFRMVDELRESMKNQHRLMIAVERMAVQMEHHTELLDGISVRLDEVEHAPGRRLGRYREIIVGCVISGILGAIIAALTALISGGAF